MNKDEQRMANIKDRCLKGCKKALRESEERVSELIAENARLNDLLDGPDLLHSLPGEIKRKTRFEESAADWAASKYEEGVLSIHPEEVKKYQKENK